MLETGQHRLISCNDLWWKCVDSCMLWSTPESYYILRGNIIINCSIFFSDRLLMYLYVCGSGKVSWIPYDNTRIFSQQDRNNF